MSELEKFFVTTPIYYINDVPHVGHAYSTIVADTVARFHRLKGEQVFFLTGLDENSVNTVKGAREAGEQDLRKYANATALKWLAVWKKLGISNDDFIRTTQERHKKNVEKFFQRVYEKGDVYKGKYEGLYCDGCEAFLKESELVNGECALHKKKPRELSEENYFFKLSKYQQDVLKHIEASEGFIEPIERKHEVINFIKQGLEDISISRPEVGWGIRFPIDEKHFFWVWFDALINYLVNEEYWPADLHVIGKDISRFHCIIWPAMLLSAGYELPKKIFVHGFFTINGRKISKSLGNAIDPVAIAEKYSVDALRYFLLSEIPLGEDGDFSEQALKARNNNELVANYGNLFYRVTSFIEKNYFGRIPVPGQLGKEDLFLKERLKKTREKTETLVEQFKLHDALKWIFSLSAEANRFVQEKKPWEEPEKGGATIYTALNIAAGISALLQPFTPNASETALKALGLSKVSWSQAGEFLLKPGQAVKPVILFKKVE